jgi:hypothetical protein
MSEKSIEKKSDMTVATALAIICIVMAVSQVGAVANYASIIIGKDDTIAARDSQISSLNSQIDSLARENYKSVTYILDKTTTVPQGTSPMGYGWMVDDIFVEGYSRMSVFLEVWGFNATPSAKAQFGIRGLFWTSDGVEVYTSDYPKSGDWWPLFNCTYGSRTYTGLKTFETYGPYAKIELGALSPTQSLSFHFTITVYLRND